MSFDGATPQSAQTVELNYQPGGPIRRRKRRVRILLVAIVLIVGLAAWLRGPVVVRRTLASYYESQLRRYTAPADRVVYEEDPALWPALLSRGHYRKFTYAGPGWNSFVAYMCEPIVWLQKNTNLPRPGATALFAHVRKSPARRERIVVVWMGYSGIRCDAKGASPDNQVGIDLCTSVWLDNNSVKDSISRIWIAPQSVAENRETTLYARIFAGQVDPADASHFSIAYQIGEYSDVLDGYLRDDDSVVLHPRSYEHRLNPR